MKEVSCKWCKKTFYVFQCKQQKFCSRICMRKYWKQNKINIYNKASQSKGGKNSAMKNKKDKTNCFFNFDLHSKIGKKSGVIGGRRCQELHPNLSSEIMSRVHKKYPNLASEMGKKNIRKSLASQKRDGKGFWNSKTQSINGLNSQKVLRRSFRNLKFKNQYYDSKMEIEISLCLQEQYNYIPKEGKTLHVKVGRMECDYLFDKTFIEFHPFWRENDIESEYRKRRRNILNENGYIDYPLIIIK